MQTTPTYYWKRIGWGLGGMETAPTYLVAALCAILLCAILLISGCAPVTPVTPAANSPAPVELTVFAAASLTDAFDEIATAFGAQHPGVTVLYSYGGSSQLATQLVEGAPADIFASANTKQMGVAQEGGRIVGEPQLFASNRLVIIVPAGNPAQVSDLAGLAQPGVHLLLAVPGVPVRDYVDQMLAAASADPAYGADFADAVYANLVSEEDNVRQVATKVALGEADAGIVYTSDVTPDLAKDVESIAVPDAYNVAATYPIALVTESAQPETAQAYVDFVLSEQGQVILAKWGFGAAP